MHLRARISQPPPPPKTQTQRGGREGETALRRETERGGRRRTRWEGRQRWREGESSTLLSGTDGAFQPRMQGQGKDREPRRQREGNRGRDGDKRGRQEEGRGSPRAREEEGDGGAASPDSQTWFPQMACRCTRMTRLSSSSRFSDARPTASSRRHAATAALMSCPRDTAVGECGCASMDSRRRYSAFAAPLWARRP